MLIVPDGMVKYRKRHTCFVVLLNLMVGGIVFWGFTAWANPLTKIEKIRAEMPKKAHEAFAKIVRNWQSSDNPTLDDLKNRLAAWDGANPTEVQLTRIFDRLNTEFSNPNDNEMIFAVDKLASASAPDDASEARRGDPSENEQLRRAWDEQRYQQYLRDQELQRAQQANQNPNGSGEGGDEGAEKGHSRGAKDSGVPPSSNNNDVGDAIKAQGNQIGDILRQQNQNQDRSNLLKDVLGNLAKSADTTPGSGKDNGEEKLDFNKLFDDLPPSSKAKSPPEDEPKKEENTDSSDNTPSTGSSPKPPRQTSIPNRAEPVTSPKISGSNESTPESGQAKMIGNPSEKPPDGVGSMFGLFDMNNLGAAFIPSSQDEDQRKQKYTETLQILSSYGGDGSSGLVGPGISQGEESDIYVPNPSTSVLLASKGKRISNEPGVFGAKASFIEDEKIYERLRSEPLNVETILSKKGLLDG